MRQYRHFVWAIDCSISDQNYLRDCKGCLGGFHSQKNDKIGSHLSHRYGNFDFTRTIKERGCIFHPAMLGGCSVAVNRPANLPVLTCQYGNTQPMKPQYRKTSKKSRADRNLDTHVSKKLHRLVLVASTLANKIMYIK